MTFKAACAAAALSLTAAAATEAQDVTLAPEGGEAAGVWSVEPGATVRLAIDDASSSSVLGARVVRDAEGAADAMSVDGGLSFFARAPGVVAAAVTARDGAGGTTFAKTFVCVAPCEDLSASFTPMGLALELVALPSGPPYARRFELLADGTPLPGAALRLRDAKGEERELQTDIEGGTSISDLPEGPVRLAASRRTDHGVETATLSFLWTEWTPGGR